MGYYATPTKTITKTEVKEVVKVVKEKEKNKQNNKMVVIVETTMPDGTKRKETKIVDKGVITITASENIDKSTDTKTETVVEHTHDSLLLYAVAEKNLSSPELSYGVGVQKRVLGPFFLGVYGTTQKNIGVTLGLSF